MRLQELDTKDHQLDELKIGQAVGAVGTGVGKAAGGVAKGLGAVAGGIAGLGSAFKKGFQTGKSTTSGDNQAPAAGSAGAAGAAGAAGTGGSAGAAGTGGSAGAAGAAGTSGSAGAAGTGAAGGSAGAAGTGGSAGAAGAAGAGGAGTSDNISTLKDRIMKLDDASRQDIMKILQKQAATAKPEPQQDQSERGVEQPGKPTFTGVPEKPAPDADQSAEQGDNKLAPGAFGKMAQDLTKPLAGADSETPGAAVPQSGGRKQGGGKVAGQLSTDPRAVKRREQRAAKKPQVKPHRRQK